MATVSYIEFCYLGVSRGIICDLNTTYEKIQKLVALTFHLPEEYIMAIQITDSHGNSFQKDLLEYFLRLFPQQKQIFYVRVDSSKIAENGDSLHKINSAPCGIKEDIDYDSDNDDDYDDAYATVFTPVRRQNCFLGTLPERF